MTRLEFGVHPADMAEPGYFGFERFFASPQSELVLLASSQIVVRDPLTGTTVEIRGAFDLSSEAGLLGSMVDRMIWRTGSADLLLDWSGLSMRVADVLDTPDPEALNSTILSGNDEIIGGAGGDMLRGYAGGDVITGRVGADRLLGEDGQDSLDGGAGADTLQGGRDADRLAGGAGDDALDGGDGTDVAVFAGDAAAYVMSCAAAGPAQLAVAGDSVASRALDGADALVDIEWLQFADRRYALSPPLPSVPRGDATELVWLPPASSAPQAAFATLGSGDLVVAWRAPGAIQAQLLGPDLLPRGTAFQLNLTGGPGDYGVYAPAVAPLPGGGFVAAWTKAFGDGSGDAVFGRLFGAGGDARSGEFLINERTAGSEQLPALATLAGGGFVAVWDRGGPGVAGQLFDATGARVGGEFDIAGLRSSAPAVAPLADGGFVVVWDPDFFSRDDDAVAQRFDAAGRPVGERIVLDGAEGGALHPHVAALASGGFVVGWAALVERQPLPHLMTTEYGVFVQRFDGAGNRTGGVTEVVPLDTQTVTDFALCALPDGGFTVAWERDGVRAARFGGDGELRGPASFVVRSPADGAIGLREAACAALADGGFLVSWAAGAYPAMSLNARLYGADWSAAEMWTIEGTALDDTLRAGAGRQALLGGAGDDTLSGAAGSDLIDGGDGLDSARFAGPRRDFTITHEGSTVTVAAVAGNDEGADRLLSVERLRFDDSALAFDLEGAAGDTVKLIGAVFGARYLIPEFIGIGIGLFDAGLTMPQVAQFALDTPLYLELAGSRSHADFVELVYRNVVGVAPDATQQSYFQGILDRGEMTQPQLAELAAQTEFNAINVGLVGLRESGVGFMAPDG